MIDHYKKLAKEDFDAIVTGELTHYALWMEDEINGFILDYFLGRSKRRAEFKSIFFERECLTFQGKLDVVKATLKQFEAQSNFKAGLKVIERIETFKGLRNAFAHGVDSDHSSELRIKIEITNRAGKKRTIEVTPESHSKTIEEAERLLGDLQTWRKESFKEFSKKITIGIN